MNYRHNLALLKFFFNGYGPNDIHQRLEERVQILSEFTIKNSVLRDKLRNLHEIQIAYANDRDVQLQVQIKVQEIQCEMNALYAETEIKLRSVPNQTNIS